LGSDVVYLGFVYACTSTEAGKDISGIIPQGTSLQESHQAIFSPTWQVGKQCMWPKLYPGFTIGGPGTWIGSKSSFEVRVGLVLEVQVDPHVHHFATGCKDLRQGVSTLAGLAALCSNIGGLCRLSGDVQWNCFSTASSSHRPPDRGCGHACKDGCSDRGVDISGGIGN
jgi:hypothetical protein